MSTPSTQRERTVFDHLLDIDNAPVAFTKVKIKSGVVINYGTGGTVINREFFTVTDENGYWAITVIPTLDFLTATNIELTFGTTNGSSADNPSEVDDKTLTSFKLAYGDGQPIQLKDAVAAGADLSVSDSVTLLSIVQEQIALALDEGEIS